MNSTGDLPIVDAHHHVWDPATGQHAWLDNFPVLRRRFDLADFAAATTGTRVKASVLVQTLALTEETQEMLALSAPGPVVGVVGWVDLTADDLPGSLGKLVERQGGPRLVGARDLAQDREDPRWLERPDVLRGLRAVARAGLAFDLLVRPPQLPSAVAAVDAVPEGRFVLDHGGKPPIEAGEMEPWSSLVGELSRRPNVVCKLSGLVTEAGPGWDEEAVRPYANRLLGCFGPDRLLFGSDWPVCTAVASYTEVVGLAWSLLEGLSEQDKAKVMAGNAVATYGLGPGGL